MIHYVLSPLLSEYFVRIEGVLIRRTTDIRIAQAVRDSYRRQGYEVTIDSSYTNSLSEVI